MADVLSTVTSDDLRTIAGGTLLISAVLPATQDQAGYDALTFTEVGGTSDLPAIGGTSNTVPFDILSDDYTSNAKGQRKYGEGTFNYATVGTDAGQIIMVAAEQSKNSYAFKILYNDGAIDYVNGLIMGTPKNNGTADTVQVNAASIVWTSTPVFVAGA